MRIFILGLLYRDGQLPDAERATERPLTVRGLVALVE